MTAVLPPPDPNATPRYDFANDGTLTGLLQQFQTQIKKDLENMLPATVISYNRETNIAEVQPAIHMVSTTGKLVGRSSVAAVPVLALGGGGFVINFPLVGGSRGWIKTNDRDISLYMQASAAAAPNSQRMHSFSDGVFIPDAVAGFTIAGEDATNMVIQNLAGTVKVALWADKVKVVAPTIDLEGVLIINGVPFLNYKPTGVQSGDGFGTGLVAP